MRSELKTGRWLWIGAFLWALSIFFTTSGVVTTNQLSHAVSTVAGGKISESGFLQFWGVVWWIFVKGWHALEFAILFILIRRAIPKHPNWALGFASLGAFLDEGHQLFVPSRGGRLSDVFIDCLGIFGAWLLIERGRFRRRECVSRLLKLIFERRWAMPLITALWIALVFSLSICPFGLITLDPVASGNMPRP